MNKNSHNDFFKIISEAILNDKQLQALHTERVKIYSLAIPTVIINDNDEAKTIWKDETTNTNLSKIDEIVEHRVNQIINFYNKKLIMFGINKSEEEFSIMLNSGDEVRENGTEIWYKVKKIDGRDVYLDYGDGLNCLDIKDIIEVKRHTQQKLKSDE
jgi:hypothetical protein